jgi:chaperonin GroEL
MAASSRRACSTRPRFRSGLQNAASIAALFLTTEGIVAETPEKEKMPAMPGGGDMDF